jgi:hypothetical protein
MFTARPDFDSKLERWFADAPSQTRYDNPSHRVVLDAEGLRRWVEPQLHGYHSLPEVFQAAGFFERN